MRFITLLGVFLFCVQNMAAINVICQDGNYSNSTSCVPCPSNCATCKSDTNCTECTSGFYGDICETPCPENCDKCRSMSYCFTCKDGFYGQNCSAMCPSECDRACNQSGNCLQCKEGYYRQADICLQCLPGCRTCDNSTYCSLCHETHVDAFLGKCIRRCSEKSTNFVSNFDQRCGISLDKIIQNQSNCFAVNLKESYKCTTLRSCISCPSEDCSRTKNESHMCLSSERCITECNPMDSSHIIRDGTTRQTLCEQTCSIYQAIDGKKEEMCPLITEDKLTSSEVIDCFQEPESTVNSSNVQNVAANNDNVRCREDYYYNSTSCVPCPFNCAACESDTNCTECTKGFYGDLCKTPCPTNCDKCRSMSYCFTCKDGFYGQNCSAMCPSECERACNQSGNCLQCKEGYYRQADVCLQCLPGCRTCDNSTYCSSCHKTHVDAFLGKCIRRCSEKSTKFVSNFDQRCGISMDKIIQNQSNCFAVNLKQSYKCTTLRSCISCPTEDCNKTKIESRTCLSYERCSTECNSVYSSHIKQDVDGTTGQTLCEQTCSIYHVIDGKKEKMCPLITEVNVTSSEVIDCLQEPESTVNSSNDHTILITIAVVAACVLVILLVGKVACQHRNRARSRLRSPEVALAEEPVQRSCGLTSQVQVTTTPLPPHRGEIPADMYDTADCPTFAADNRAHDKNSVPLQRRGIPADMYDKANCSTFVADNRACDKNSVPLQRRGIPADRCDAANCSTFVADNRACDKNSVPLQRRGIPADRYDTANCSTFVADNRACDKSSVPLQRRGIPADRYDTAKCSTFVTDNRAHDKSSVPLERRGITADMYDKANCSTFVADNRAYNKNSVPLQRRGIPADMYDTANCSTVVADNGAYTAYCNTAVTEDYINNTLVCPLQKSCVDNDGDNDEYDYVYFDPSAPADDTSQKLPP